MLQYDTQYLHITHSCICFLSLHCRLYITTWCPT